MNPRLLAFCVALSLASGAGCSTRSSGKEESSGSTRPKPSTIRFVATYAGDSTNLDLLREFDGEDTGDATSPCGNNPEKWKLSLVTREFASLEECRKEVEKSQAKGVRQELWSKNSGERPDTYECSPTHREVRRFERQCESSR